METDELLIRKAKELGTDRIELYTGLLQKFLFHK